MPVCRFLKIHPDAQCPKLQSEHAAGYDLASIETITVPAHGRALIHTGLKVALPPQTHLEIRPRSGLALKYGITVLNSPGTVDSDYRGEIIIVLYNTSEADFIVHPGDRIAQAIVTEHLHVQWQQVDDFEQTERGEHGFGSTGY